MLVEFVGPSGAGKSTLVRRTAVLLTERGFDPMLSATTVARATGTEWIRSDSLRNVVLNAMLFPWWVESVKQFSHCRSLAKRVIARDGTTVLDRFNRRRSFSRLLAQTVLLSSRAKLGQLVLVDEGAVGSSHNLFVHLGASYRPAEICEYVSMAPFPEVVIHVDAPTDVALRRTLRRPDPPLGGHRTPEEFECFIARAREVFARIGNMGEPGLHWLTVSNTRSGDRAISVLAERIADFIVQELNQGARKIPCSAQA